MNTFINITSSAIVALVLTGGVTIIVVFLIMGAKSWKLVNDGLDTIHHGVKVIDKALDKIEGGT